MPRDHKAEQLRGLVEEPKVDRLLDGAVDSAAVGWHVVPGLVEVPQDGCDLALLELRVAVGVVCAVGQEGDPERQRKPRVQCVVVPGILKVS